MQLPAAAAVAAAAAAATTTPPNNGAGKRKRTSSECGQGGHYHSSHCSQCRVRGYKSAKCTASEAMKRAYSVNEQARMAAVTAARGRSRHVRRMRLYAMLVIARRASK